MYMYMYMFNAHKMLYIRHGEGREGMKEGERGEGGKE